MEKKTLSWVADDDFETRHVVSEEFVIKTLKALYDEWPGGLEEIQACMRNLRSGHALKESMLTKIVQDLTAQYKETVNKPIYVLTEEYNDYDQYGEYFVHAWLGKPNKGQLHDILYHGEDLDHILNGGGRTRKNENHWYHLKELNV